MKIPFKMLWILGSVTQIFFLLFLFYLPKSNPGTGLVTCRKQLNRQMGGMVDGTGSNTSNDLDKGVTNKVSNKQDKSVKYKIVKY